MLEYRGESRTSVMLRTPTCTSRFPSARQDRRPCIIALCSDCLVGLAARGDASPSLLLSTMAGAELTRSATEQPDVAMDSSLAVPAGPARQIDSTGPVHAMDLGTLPSVSQLQWEIHVDFNNGMWWAMPHFLSDDILEQWKNGAQQVSFVWDWKIPIDDHINQTEPILPSVDTL